ncbi:MAG: AsnC family transcriptional regulator [Candidatus Odinarchaeota archaeon]
MDDLSHDDFKLLLALQEQPLASNSALARVVDVSQPTVTNRLKSLKEKLSLYNVHTDLDPDAISMELYDFVLDISTAENVKLLEKLCDEHPYTLYRAREFGRTSGLFVQFRIPKDTGFLLVELMDSLKSRNLITGYKILKRSRNGPAPVYTTTSLAHWDYNAAKWEFDWELWRKQLASSPTTLPEKPRRESVLSNLTELDIQLLAELTQDARQRNSEIIEKIGLDKETHGLRQKVSRRLEFLKKEVVLGYRVFLNWEVFDTYHTFVFACKASEENTARLYNNLDTNRIPFQSTYVILENGFFWAVQAPPSHFSVIGEIITEYSKERELLLLDYKTSEVYGLWDKTYDSKSKLWRTSIMSPEQILTAIDKP